MRNCPARGCKNGRHQSALTCWEHWNDLPLGTKKLCARLIKAGRALRARRIAKEVLGMGRL